MVVETTRALLTHFHFYRQAFDKQRVLVITRPQRYLGSNFIEIGIVLTDHALDLTTYGADISRGQ